MDSTPHARLASRTMLGSEITIGSRVIYRGVNTGRWRGGRVVDMDPDRFQGRGGLQVKRDEGVRGWMTIGDNGVCALFDERLLGQPVVIPGGRAAVRYFSPISNEPSSQVDKRQRSVSRDLRRPHPLFSESRTGNGSPPPPDLFVREDVRKDENRVNLALFSLMMVPSFRRWFLGKLNLHPEAYVYPPQNQAGGRPDFVVVGPPGVVLAWIEIELGGENTSQLTAYRTNLVEPVKSVIGVPGYGGDLTLVDIADAVADLLNSFDRQQAMNAAVLVKLIDELAHPPRGAQYIDPGEGVRANPLIEALAQRLPEVLVFGTGAIKPGSAQVMAMSKIGWTIRVYSTQVSGGSVSLMNRPTNARGVRIPSRSELDRCLPLGGQAIDKYCRLMLKLDIDIGKIGTGYLPVDQGGLLGHVDELAECIRALAGAYGGVFRNGSS